MFTANLAGTSGGGHYHHRPDSHHHRPFRDHAHHGSHGSFSHSRHGSHAAEHADSDDGGGSVAGMYAQPAMVFAHGGVDAGLRLPGDVPTYDIQYELTGVHSSLPAHMAHAGNGGGGSGGSARGSSGSSHHIHSLKDEEEFSLKDDWKSLVYLVCVAAIVIGGVVLIILAAMGHFNDTRTANAVITDADRKVYEGGDHSSG